ncbi:recombinase family protein [Streptomyces antimycoticus]|uniref:recombinase family protein n=1 Tax=Streptomyces antimycoticus TaxID=68175 RepID=UPI0034136A7A
MANLVYKRVSTDQQSTARQNLVLDEAGIEDPVVFEEDGGTSRRHLQPPPPAPAPEVPRAPRLRPARGHRAHLRDVPPRTRHRAHPRRARRPVQTLAAAGELQRDLQGELTYDGLRAAEAKGSKGGRRPAVPADKTGDVRTAYLEGRSIAALARDHRVSRGAIRTAVADLLPDHTADEEAAPALELLVTLDMPGKVADFLRTAELEAAERAALAQG